MRATKVKEKEINGNTFELTKNTPKQIDKENNSHIAHIHEDGENEDVYIHSQFDDDAFAMIGNEFYLNFLKLPKKVDISYYYFALDSKVSIFLYDMKKTFAGKNDIINLIEQWKSSIIDAKYCIMKLDDYEISNIKIGVITEENDAERRKRELQPILHPDVISRNIPSFIKSNRKANISYIIPQAMLLKGFDEGKVTICGDTYEFDIREFDDKKHHMYFVNGVLN